MIRLITLAKSFRIAAIALATIAITIAAGYAYTRAAPPQSPMYLSTRGNLTEPAERMATYRGNKTVQARYCHTGPRTCGNNGQCALGCECDSADHCIEIQNPRLSTTIHQHANEKTKKF